MLMTMKEKMVMTYGDDDHGHQHCGMAKMQRHEIRRMAVMVTMRIIL